MRRKSLVSCLAILVMTLFSSSVLAAGGPVDLKVVGSWNSLSLYKNFEKPFWSKTLPEILNGKVKTDVTSFDQMGLKGSEVFRFFGLKLIDVGSTVADYVVADCPALEGLDLPAMAPDIQTARQVVQAYRPVLAEAMKTCFNAKLLSVVPYPAQVLFINKKITKLKDLKGMKIRASGRTTAEFIDALGATGVTLAFSEVPQSLQRGVVDGAVTGSLSGYSAGWGEVAKYLYPLPVGGWDYVITGMRMGKWNELDSATQKKMMDAIAKDLEAPVWEAVGKETQQGINCLTGNGECSYGTPNKMTLIPVSQGDIALSKKILEDQVLPQWAGRVDKDWVVRWNQTIGKVVGLAGKVQ